MLLVVALAEVAIERVALPMLRPESGELSLWLVVLDYFGLFLFYFTGCLAALVIFARSISAIEAARGLRDIVAHATLGLAALIAAVPLVVSIPEWTSVVIGIAFGVALVAMVANVFGKNRDVGVQIGLPIIVLPLLLHTVALIGAEFIWTENTIDGPGQTLVKVGVIGLCLAGLATPYCFAPRPFAHSVTRPAPVVFAMVIAAIGAVLARLSYAKVAKASLLAIGIEMTPGQADQKLALYLLAVATLGWTLGSCAIARSQARRTIGAGLALIILGGYGFHWSHHHLLPLLGVALIADAARRVREEELEALPFIAEAPPIADSTWSTYIGAITSGLRRSLDGVHSLTTRGEGGLTSSIIVGDAKGLPVRTRIERIEGSVLALDIVIGREIDEVRGSTLTVWAMPKRGMGANPPGPPAAPIFKSGDVAFDERFRARGNAVEFDRMFAGDARAKAVTTLDGWFAYWIGEGVRYRVYPGRGAPLDHPLPLSDLALGRVPTAERLVAVVELLVELGARVIDPPPPAAEPAELDAP